uniref:Uncharacterized protein n=1 Tax=Salix viminalis TaxID=40686 RepID=A0A6N2LCG3_SALVM
MVVQAVLYRPSVTHFLAVLGTICEELAPDGVILIYLSASGRVGHPISPPSGGGTSINTTENTVRNFQSHAMYLDAVSTSPFSSSSNSPNPSSRQSKSDCLHFGTRGNGGLNSIYPTDLIPFTRRPLFIVIDSYKWS